MRFSSRLFQSWVTPLVQVSREDEQAVVSHLLTLDRAFDEAPRIVRALSDRSLSQEARLNWLLQSLDLSSTEPLAACLGRVVLQEGFQVWSKFFHEYLRFRERRGFGRVYLLRSQAPLSREERALVQARVEHRSESPVTLYPVIDETLGAGVRVESLDGWVLDASLQGRLNRLALSLAT